MVGRGSGRKGALMGGYGRRLHRRSDPPRDPSAGEAEQDRAVEMGALEIVSHNGRVPTLDSSTCSKIRVG